MPREQNQIRSAANDILPILNEITRSPRNASLMNEVQGFAEFHFGFANRTPINIKNIFGPKFSRDFNPLLNRALEEMQSEPTLNKSDFHKALLQKYLGINIAADIFIPTLESNAYHSLPEEGSLDAQLHIFYLQPFKLFGFSEKNRKFIKVLENPNANREWRWKAEGGDIAPILRKIIQLYIVRSILTDYQNPENPFSNHDVAAKLSQLQELDATLLGEIKFNLNSFFHELNHASNALHDPSGMQGNPSGLLTGEVSDGVLESLLPGFMDIAAFYPIGRLLLGQSRTEVHHTVAQRAIDPSRNAFVKYLNYFWMFFFTHLNLSTSLFWIKASLRNIFNQWEAFRNFVTNQPNSHEKLLFQTLLFIPHLLIVVSSPLLILLPGLYGLTSLPFTALRYLCMHGPIPQLRNFTLLKVFDGFELIKDILLFFIYAIPILTLLVATFNLLLPSIVLTVGTITSFVFILLLEAFANQNNYNYVDVDGIYALASTNYFQLFGAALSLGVTSYLGSAYIARGINIITPRFIKDQIERVLTPVSNLVNRFELAIKNHLLAERTLADVKNIIPAMLAQPSMAIPKILIFQPNQLQQAEIDAMTNKLGKLNLALHLKDDQKAKIKQLLRALNINDETTHASLEETLTAAKAYLTNSFDASEVNRIKAIIAHLEADHKTRIKDIFEELQTNQAAPATLEAALDEAKECLRTSTNAGEAQRITGIIARLEQLDRYLGTQLRMEKFFVAQPNIADIYQPSWKLLQVLHDRGYLQADQLNGPLTLTEGMRAKCRQIRTLQLSSVAPSPAAPRDPIAAVLAPLPPSITPQHAALASGDLHNAQPLPDLADEPLRERAAI